MIDWWSTVFFAAGVAGQIPPPPPVIVDARPAAPALLMWRPGEVRCGAVVERFADLQTPASALSWTPAPPGGVFVRFRIDQSGRPLGIARTATGYVANGGDLLPSLAASRFAPGAERLDCAVTYAAERVALSDAPVEALMAYYMNPTGGALPRPALDRIFAGGNCVDPAPAPLLRGFPAFMGLPALPGARSWSMVGFDLDRAGRPVRARRVAGSGNVALDRASVDAVARSRFTSGARTGCRYPYWRAAGVLAAPESPSQALLRPADATCPAKLPFVRQPTLTFPQAYQRRSIEGWAMVAFDVAPWGAVGNARVLAAEPSAEFGSWAMGVLANATKATSGAGYTGCVEKVRFRIGDQERLRINGKQAQPATTPPDLVVD